MLDTVPFYPRSLSRRDCRTSRLPVIDLADAAIVEAILARRSSGGVLRMSMSFLALVRTAQRRAVVQTPCPTFRGRIASPIEAERPPHTLRAFGQARSRIM